MLCKNILQEIRGDAKRIPTKGALKGKVTHGGWWDKVKFFPVYCARKIGLKCFFFSSAGSCQGNGAKVEHACISFSLL